MDVSVIIGLSAPDYDLVTHQLKMLRRQQTLCEYEIVIGDNSGFLELPPDIESRSIKVVDASARPGVAYARNRAVDRATAPILLFCDADDLVSPDWIEAHRRALCDHPFTAGSFLTLSPGDARLEDAIAAGQPFAADGFSLSIRQHEGIPFATSANLGVHREAFHRVSGFPERYLRSQDVAFSLALRAQGIDPHFVAQARVLKVSRERGRSASVRAEFRAGRSRVRIAREFGVDPSTGRLVLRSLGRTARSCFGSIRPTRQRGRSPVNEAAQLAGVIVQTLSAV